MFLSQGSILRGALFSFLGFTIFVCSDAFTKSAGLTGISPSFIMCLSGWAAVITVLLGLLPSRDYGRLKPKRWKLQGLRTVLFLLCSYVNVIAFTNLPLTTVYIGLFASPFLISLVGALFLHEPLGRRQIFAIGLGFFGVLIALLPEMQPNTSPDAHKLFIGFLALAAFLVLYVATMLILRVLGRTEAPESSTLIPFLARGLVFLPCLWIDPVSQIPASTILMTIGVGVCAGLGFLLTASAYKLAPVAIVSSFHYTQLVTGAFLGYLLWGTVPSLWVFAGGALIITSGFIVAHEAHRQNREAVAQRLVLKNQSEQGLA